MCSTGRGLIISEVTAASERGSGIVIHTCTWPLHNVDGIACGLYSVCRVVRGNSNIIFMQEMGSQIRVVSCSSYLWSM